MSWLSNLFGGGSNPAGAAMPYINQIPGQTNPYFEPYTNKGKDALNTVTKHYEGILNDPGGTINKFGESFQNSPGFKFALENALHAASNAAAAGGMAGTPQHQYQAMEAATGLANQDYYNWLGKTLGLYGAGLSGENDITHLGYDSAKNQAEMIAQVLKQQADLAFRGEQEKNAQRNSLLGGLGRLGGGILGFGAGGLKGALNAFNGFKLD